MYARNYSWEKNGMGRGGSFGGGYVGGLLNYLEGEGRVVSKRTFPPRKDFIWPFKKREMEWVKVQGVQKKAPALRAGR